MFSNGFYKKNFSMILYGYLSLAIEITGQKPRRSFFRPLGGKLPRRGNQRAGKFTSLACRGVQRGNPSGKPGSQRLPSLYGSPGRSLGKISCTKGSGARIMQGIILVYLVCQICGCDTVSGMPDRGLKGAKAPSQVSKVSRQAITLGNLQYIENVNFCVYISCVFLLAPQDEIFRTHSVCL